jgi:hypothetical protein
MDPYNSQLKNINRASWRTQCRNHLAQHICKAATPCSQSFNSLLGIGEQLGIQLKPEQVRLKSTEELQYVWKIDDPLLEPVFDKHLSKHSVRVYMQLSREVGQSFHAVRYEGMIQVQNFRIRCSL